MTIAERVGSGRARWFPAAVSAVGVVAVYVLWTMGHPYLALGAALVGSVISINHYLLSMHGGVVEPYWVFFLPLLLALSAFAMFRDFFGAMAAAYIAVVVIAIASSSPNMMESVLGEVMSDDNRAVMVLGAAALAALTYLYIYGVGADPIGFWVMAGPLVEYFIVRRVLLDAGGENRPAFTTLLHAYSAASSLMFLPTPYLGAYAILANSVKGVARGRFAAVSLLGDYLVRVSLLVLLNPGRVPMPADLFPMGESLF